MKPGRPLSRAIVAALVLSTVTCDGPFATTAHGRRVTLTLSAATAPASLAVQGPFVSVVDSIALAVTSSQSSPIVLGKRLSRRDTVVSFSLDLPDGAVVFEATVFSANHTVLFSGMRAIEVDRADVSTSVPLVARSPVLLVAPDTVSVTAPAPPSFTQTTIVVHNRGVGVLEFTIRDTFEISRTQCSQRQLTCFRFTTLPTKLAAGASLAMRIDSIRRFQTPIPVTFSSSEGDVIFVIRTP